MGRLKNIILAAGIAAPLLGAFVFTANVAAAQSSSSTLAADAPLPLTPEEKLAKAKEDLNKALDLSLKKVGSLKGRLNDLNFPELSDEAGLKKEALQNLDSYADYYNTAKHGLEGKNNLDEVKELAREIKEYRDTTYTPGMERIVRFILVFYNEDVLGVANDRLSKIEADVKKLNKLGVIEVGDFRSKLDEANKLLLTAAKLQGGAKKIILTATSTRLTKEEGATAKDMIEESLTGIKTVYDIFLELNQSVKKTLGL